MATSLSSLPRRAAALTALAAVLSLAACSSESTDETPAPAETTAAVVESSPSTETTKPAPAPDPAAVSVDICDLVTEEEVTAILGDHVVATDFTYGSIAEGGQCIWTTDPSGDVFGAGAGQLELVAWVPGGIFPPPAEAPAAGTAGTAGTGGGAYFTSADRVFWLRVTGAAYLDAALITAAQTLATTVDGRV